MFFCWHPYYYYYYIQEHTCSTVALTNLAYEIEEEIIVTRRVTILGSPATMPVLNGKVANRIFRVVVRGLPLPNLYIPNFV